MIPPATMTVGPSPRRILGSVALASVAFTVGLTLLVVFLEYLGTIGLLGFLGVAPWLWSARWVIVAGTSALVACYCGFAAVGAVVWNRPRIEIGPEGFVDYGFVGHRSRRWSDIEGGFTVIRAGLHRVVAYRLTDAFKSSATGRSADSLAGNDEAIMICGELTVGAEGLADLLNRWKQGIPGSTSSS